MNLTKAQIKRRYFDKVYNNAPTAQCACGCGEQLKTKDHYGRDQKYINGHNGRKYNDPTEYKRHWNHTHRSQRQAYKMNRARARKRALIIDAGGKCSLCGLPFVECTSIFDFHHKDPASKSFNLNNASLTKFNKAEIILEAQKCELLCAVCHRLVHWDWSNNTADSR